MMKATPIIFLLALCFCPVSCSQADPQAALQKIKDAGIGIQGGDGQSMETAIVLTEKTPAVIRQEYVIFESLYGFRPDIQRLSEKAGHHYDVLRGKDKTLYFDITAYWQHEYGK